MQELVEGRTFTENVFNVYVGGRRKRMRKRDEQTLNATTCTSVGNGRLLSMAVLFMVVGGGGL